MPFRQEVPQLYLGSPIGRIHESTISLRFLCIILRFLRLEGSTFGFGCLRNAIHEQT
jgi:hypothetical protein